MSKDDIEAAYWAFDARRAGRCKRDPYGVLGAQPERDAFKAAVREHVNAPPIQMRLPCPECGALHIDEGEFATKAHHTHACQHCGNVWRPAVETTVGVRFLPGFKNTPPPPQARDEGDV